LKTIVRLTTSMSARWLTGGAVAVDEDRLLAAQPHHPPAFLSREGHADEDGHDSDRPRYFLDGGSNAANPATSAALQLLSSSPARTLVSASTPFLFHRRDEEEPEDDRQRRGRPLERRSPSPTLPSTGHSPSPSPPSPHRSTSLPGNHQAVTIVASDNEVANGFVKDGRRLPYVFEASESGT
jgi:hypothetical protein